MPLLSQAPFVFFLSSEMSSGLLSVSPFPPSLTHSLSLPHLPGLHGPTKPLLLHRRNRDSATQRNSWFLNQVSTVLKQHLNKLFVPTLMSVYQKCDNMSPEWLETNEIPLCGHDWPVCCTCRGTFAVQTGSECPRWVISFWAHLWCWFEKKNKRNILTRARDDDVTQSDVNRRKKAHCWNMHAPLPSPSSCV